MPADDHPKTRFETSRQTVSTNDESNLVPGQASNENNPKTTTTTTDTAAAAAAANDGDNSTSLGSSRTNETVRRTLFSTTNTADEAAIGNKETESSESDEEQEPHDAFDTDPNDQHPSNNNTAIMPATTISAIAFDADLQDILSRVLEIDLNSTPPHDIVEGLTHYGCFTWKALRRMGSRDIAGLSKKSGQTQVPLMGYSLRQLAKFYEF